MRYLKIFYLLFLIFLSAYFRFVNLGDNPGIYNDEGTLLNISMNLNQGKSEYLGIEESWLLAGRMPLFPLLLSLVFQFTDSHLLVVLRSFSAASGVLSVVLLYLFLQNIIEKETSPLAFLSPLVLALHPKIVLFSRIGFGYNLLLPLTILIFWFLWLLFKTKQIRWLILASILCGIGTLVEAAYVAFMVFLFLAIGAYNWKKLPLSFVFAFLPLLIYFFASYIMFGDSFLFDWQVTFGRGTAQSIFYQIAHVFLNLISFGLNDVSFLVGVFGILGLQNSRLSIFSFFGLLIPLIIISRTFLTLHQSYYYFLPYVGFLAIGIGNFVLQISKWVHHFSQETVNLLFAQKISQNTQKLVTSLLFELILLFTIIAPSGILIYDLNLQVQKKLAPPFENLLIDLDELDAVSKTINPMLQADDLIIASPAVAWAIKGNVTDYQISIAVNETGTIHFPGGIPAERMRFDSKIDNARYVIWDTILESWNETQIPGIEKWREEIFNHWEPVFNTESLIVFENPNPK